MNIKTETWNGYEIRFVEKEAGDWWAVAVDVTKALGLSQNTRALSSIKPENRMICTLTNNKGRKYGVYGINKAINIINEFAIYCLIFKSRKKEAESFQEWVYNMLKTLRQSTGLEGFQIFRMLDKEHQKEAMKRLKQDLVLPVQIDFIRANTIANKID